MKILHETLFKSKNIKDCRLRYKRIYLQSGTVMIDDKKYNIMELPAINDASNFSGYCIDYNNSYHLERNVYHSVTENLLKKVINTVLEDIIDTYFEVNFDTVTCEIRDDIPVFCTHTPKWFYENCTPLEYIKIMKDAEKYIEEE